MVFFVNHPVKLEKESNIFDKVTFTLGLLMFCVFRGNSKQMRSCFSKTVLLFQEKNLFYKWMRLTSPTYVVININKIIKTSINCFILKLALNIISKLFPNLHLSYIADEWSDYTLYKLYIFSLQSVLAGIIKNISWYSNGKVLWWWPEFVPDNFSCHIVFHQMICYIFVTWLPPQHNLIIWYFWKDSQAEIFQRTNFL